VKRQADNLENDCAFAFFHHSQPYAFSPTTKYDRQFVQELAADLNE
jgi:hypothetical protein